MASEGLAGSELTLMMTLHINRRHRSPKAIIQLRIAVFRDKIMLMLKPLILAGVLCLGGAVVAQEETSNPQAPDQQQPSSAQEQSASQSGESSSKDSDIDISPPPDDAKNHPDSAAAVNDAEVEAGANNSSVEEFHQWNPHKAMKDIEVGDFYFKQKNYKAALSRYQEALEYKPNDAVANFRTAQCFEKLNNPHDAVEHYEAYLKILPHGPFSGDAQKALTKLQGADKSTQNQPR